MSALLPRRSGRDSTGARRRFSAIRRRRIAPRLLASPAPAQTRRSELDHLEVRFFRGAVGTPKALGHVGPASSRRDAFLRHSRSFVVYERAEDALPRLEFAVRIG